MPKRGVVPNNPYYKSAHWLALRAACIKRDGGRCVVPGCTSPGKVVDHVITRPRVAYPTALDRIDNVRLICQPHDAQTKEGRDGKRFNGGKPVVTGCDDSGMPLDPNHPWRLGR